MDVTIKQGEEFSDGLGKVRVKQNMVWHISPDHPQTRFGKIETYAGTEEELRDRLQNLLPYMYRNWVDPYEDNFNGMRDWLLEYLEKVE